MDEFKDRPTLQVRLNAVGKGEVLLDGKKLPSRLIEIRAELGHATTAFIELVGINVDLEAPVDVKEWRGVRVKRS